MKLKIVPVKRYEIQTVEGLSVGEFNVESEWHGMTRLVSTSQTKDEVIILGTVSPGLAEVLLPSEDATAWVRDVVAVSPRLNRVIELVQVASEVERSDE